MRRVLVAALLLGGVTLSVLEAKHQHPGSDFHARWLAGRWFWSGAPLYAPVPGVREPTYPPFAAMVFQVFAAFPFKVAAGLFYFFSLLLIPVAVRLTTDVFDQLWPDRPHERWRLALAGLFSAQFFLNNMNLDQVNIALFVLCLLGIRWYLAGRDVPAAAALAGATAIKVVPVFLALWLVLRGRRRAAVAVIVSGLAFVALPMLQRGPAAGVQDLSDYYHSILSGFQKGRVIASYTNQDLDAAVQRLTQPPVAPPDQDYSLIHVSEHAAHSVARAATGLVVAAFLATLIWLRARAAPLTVFEPSAAFLVGHLVSPITWKAHLVTLLFVYYAVLSLRWRERTTGERALIGTVVTLMAFAGFAGRDVIGDALHHAVGGYSLFVWLMLLLFVAALWFACRAGAAAPKPAS